MKKPVRLLEIDDHIILCRFLKMLESYSNFNCDFIPKPQGEKIL